MESKESNALVSSLNAQRGPAFADAAIEVAARGGRLPSDQASRAFKAD